MSLRNRWDTNGTLAEARQVVRRPDFRRAIIAGTLALAAPGVVAVLGVQSPQLSHRVIAYGAIAACAIFGFIAVRSAANEVARLVRHRGGPSVANVLRLVITLFGYLMVVSTVLSMTGVPIDKLLLSGAITGVVVGIAAQQSLGNAFAGLALVFSRPFAVGDYITLRSGSLGGQFDGEVTAISLMYTVLLTEDGPMSIPNSGVLAAATGRRSLARPTEEAEDSTAKTVAKEPARGPYRTPRRKLRATSPTRRIRARATTSLTKRS